MRSLLIAIGISLFALSGAHAETCLSPFVKRLKDREKILYVYCVDADAKDNDFLAVIDVDPKSKSYGTIINKLDLGCSGNETHHFGFTDDRTHIWGCSLFSSKIFVINVADNPKKPRLVKVIDSTKSGFTGPHTPYAIPGRMFLSFLGGKDEGLPTGLAEFRNDGELVRTFKMPENAPYGYDLAIQPDLNRFVTSSFTFPRNYRKPLAKMDMKKFGNKVLVWDYRKRKILSTLTMGAAPLECRWSLKKENNYGFTNCALDNSIWVWEGTKDGKYTARKLCQTGKLPVDLRQSPDDKYLFVSCFFSDEIQQWDVSDIKKPKLVSTLKPGVQPNMMHVTYDGKRMYITNSLLSTMDQSGQFWVKLAHITDDGLKLDKTFHLDLTKLPTGPARGHDMLLY